MDVSDGNDFLKLPFQRRAAISNHIKKEYENTVPAIILLNPKSDLPALNKFKILLPNDIFMGRLMVEIRKQFAKHDLDNSSKGLYLTVNNKIVSASDSAEKIYIENRSNDGFLYVTVSAENTFGTWL